MGEITLADGRTTNTASFGISTSGYMFIRVAMSMTEAVEFFSSGTETITYTSGEESHTFNGFTNLSYVVNEGNLSRVALTRHAEFWEE